jgi:hypothetical protein
LFRRSLLMGQTAARKEALFSEDFSSDKRSLDKRAYFHRLTSCL